MPIQVGVVQGFLGFCGSDIPKYLQANAKDEIPRAESGKALILTPENQLSKCLATVIRSTRFHGPPGRSFPVRFRPLFPHSLGNRRHETAASAPPAKGAKSGARSGSDRNNSDRNNRDERNGW